MGKLYFRKPIIPMTEYSKEPFGQCKMVIEPKYQNYIFNNSGKHALLENDEGYKRARDFMLIMMGSRATKPTKE